jgi:hypothetical protein
VCSEGFLDIVGGTHGPLVKQVDFITLFLDAPSACKEF